MALLETRITLLIGATVAAPAPPVLIENLTRVTVTRSAQAPSGFQLTFAAGRSGPADLVDFPLLTTPLLRLFHRVVLLVQLDATPRVLIDGVITHRELVAGSGAGTRLLTVTGEDVSVLMDLEERVVEHPAQDETLIATALIARYPRYGLIPQVIPPPTVDLPIPIERIPVQHGTDLAYLRQMADRYGYIFTITPGPAPMTNLAYWGPPIRVGVPDRALSVDLDVGTNVGQVSFRSDGLAPTRVVGSVQDRRTDLTLPVASLGSLRPPLAALPDWLVNLPNVRTTRFRDSGLSAPQALARAQGAAEAAQNSVTVTGTLDTLRYGDLLTPGGLVGLRGAGWQHNGLYQVDQVTHQIDSDGYSQRFVLSREGLGSTIPLVRP